MRKVVVTEYITLDGIMESPNKWSLEFWDSDTEKFKYDELFASDTLLLGRKTYEGFAQAWPTMTDNTGFAERMNSIEKYVVSSTLANADWNNSHIIKENIVDEINKLKAMGGMDILVAGSADLVSLLMENNLVDEFRFMLYPIVVGEGKKLFNDKIKNAKLKLTSSKSTAKGVVILTYEPIKQI